MIGGGLGVVWLSAFCLCLGCSGESPKEHAAREAREAQQRQEEAQIEARAEQRRQELDEQADRAAVEQEAARQAAQRATFAAMTPAAREATLRSACSTSDGCDAEVSRLIIEAAANAVERKKLERQRTSLNAQLAVKARTQQPPTQPRSAPPSRPPNTGRVCCCDGTLSPTCTTVHRGCCSHHGGVCACQ